MDNNKRSGSIVVVVPAFNEANKIGEVLSELVAAGYTVVAVDDGSQDQTHAVASGYPVHVLRHQVNRGQGAALQTGIDYALSLEPAAIVTFDADGQHSVHDISTLTAPILAGTHDVIFGSRFRGTVINMPRLRKLCVLSLTQLFKRVNRVAISDANCGIRAFSPHAAAQLRITQHRMAHALEIIQQVADKKLRYSELPVTVEYTPYSLHKGQKLRHGGRILLDWFTPVMKNRKGGFSLIELSIVLVIIGLVIGGVMVGRDLMKMAKLRGILSQIESYNTAMMTYRTKYNGLAGDLSNATSYFPADAAGCPEPDGGTAGPSNVINSVCDGDGNGIITGGSSFNYSCTNYGDPGCWESSYMWASLRLAGLISDTVKYISGGRVFDLPGHTVPLLRDSDRGGITLGWLPSVANFYTVAPGYNPGHNWIMGAMTGSQGLGDFGLTPYETGWIDGKIDDGLAGTGRMHSLMGWGEMCADANGQYYLHKDYMTSINAADPVGCYSTLKAAF